MPNIKSAKKRVLVIEKKTMQNKAIKSAVKTSIKKVNVAVANKDKEAAAAKEFNEKQATNKKQQKENDRGIVDFMMIQNHFFSRF